MIMNKRGVLFFTTDTMIAALVLTMTAILVSSFFVNQPTTSDVSFQINQYSDYIRYTDMGNIDTFVATRPPGDSEQADLKIHEKILYLHEQEGNSESFVQNLSDLLVSDAFGISYSIDDSTVFKSDLGYDPEINLSESIMTYFVYEDELHGPNITKVSIWY